MINTNRALVMECSVGIEQMISNQVCLLMDIDRKSSKLFGFGSTSISFNQKVEILTELKYYSKEQKEKLNRFAEIRNKFAHLAEITTFEECFSAIQGLENKLNKWFPAINSDPQIPKEEVFIKLFYALYEGIAKDIDRFVTHYNDRLHQRYSLEVKSDNYDALLDALVQVGKEFKNPVIAEFTKKLLIKTDEIFKVLDAKRATDKVQHRINPL